MADRNVDEVLLIGDVVLQRLPLHLLGGAVVVIARDEVPACE